MTREEQIAEAAMLEAYKKRTIQEAYNCELDFAAGAAWADAHPSWISVEDELPPKESEYEDNSIVVLATDGNDVYKGLYRSGEYLSGWFTCDLWGLDDITHWMPMPESPKEGGEE